MVKWNRKLGTSKRAQGIETPKAPQNQPGKPGMLLRFAPYKPCNVKTNNLLEILLNRMVIK